MRTLFLLGALAGVASRDTQPDARSLPASAASIDGTCYDTVANAYKSTVCQTTSQILEDPNRQTVCSGVAMANATFYCPSWFQTGNINAQNNGTCYSTQALTVQYTTCSQSTVLSSTTVCQGAPSRVTYYCPAVATVSSFFSGSFLTMNGYCYSSRASAAAGAGCTVSQVASDLSGTGICLGAPVGVSFYCPAVLDSPAASQANINKCMATVQAQFAASNASRTALAISSASCKTCSNACPTAFGSVAEGYDPMWWLCLAGGRTSTTISNSASATITFCTVHPSSGFWCVVIIPPILLALISAYFCYANRTKVGELATRARNSFTGRISEVNGVGGPSPARPSRQQELILVANPLNNKV